MFSRFSFVFLVFLRFLLDFYNHLSYVPCDSYLEHFKNILRSFVLFWMFLRYVGNCKQILSPYSEHRIKKRELVSECLLPMSFNGFYKVFLAFLNTKIKDVSCLFCCSFLTGGLEILASPKGRHKKNYCFSLFCFVLRQTTHKRYGKHFFLAGRTSFFFEVLSGQKR